MAPSLPGFGWSDKPSATGWTVERIARAWDELMGRLGYERYAAQGGDWGAGVTNMLAKVAPDRLIGVHVNMAAAAFDGAVLGEPTPAEQKTIDDLVHRDGGVVGADLLGEQGAGRRLRAAWPLRRAAAGVLPDAAVAVRVGPRFREGPPGGWLTRVP